MAQASTDVEGLTSSDTVSATVQMRDSDGDGISNIDEYLGLTQAQRESVQGKPCVDCGVTTPKQYADHKDPLVKEYYRTGTIDKKCMRDIDSVQPQCPSCSNKQGAEKSRFSRQQKKDRGL